MRTRRPLLRAAALVALCGVAVLLYTLGKAYILLLDNKAVESVGGATLPAFDTVRVEVDGRDAIELYPRDRDQLTVTGRSHRLTVKVLDRGGRELETREVDFRIPGKERMFLISLPALVGGAQEWLTEFVPSGTAALPDEEEPPAADETLVPEVVLPEE